MTDRESLSGRQREREAQARETTLGVQRGDEARIRRLAQAVRQLQTEVEGDIGELVRATEVDLIARQVSEADTYAEAVGHLERLGFPVLIEAISARLTPGDLTRFNSFRAAQRSEREEEARTSESSRADLALKIARAENEQASLASRGVASEIEVDQEEGTVHLNVVVIDPLTGREVQARRTEVVVEVDEEGNREADFERPTLPDLKPPPPPFLQLPGQTLPEEFVPTRRFESGPPGTLQPGLFPREVSVGRRFRQGAAEDHLNAMSTENRAQLAADLVAAGLLSREEAGFTATSEFGSGSRTPQLRQAYEIVLAHADWTGQSIPEAIAELIEAAPSEEEKRERRRQELLAQRQFIVPAYIAPDYDTLSVAAKDLVRAELGRDPSDAEMRMLADAMASSHRQNFDTQVSAERAEFNAENHAFLRAQDLLEEGALTEPVTGAAQGSFQAEDPVNSMRVFFDEQFGPELERRDTRLANEVAGRNVAGNLTALHNALGAR